MGNDLISRSALLDDVLVISDENYNDCHVVFEDDIENAPSVDAVEVVRCKDCKYDNMTTCPLCWIENHTLQFVNHDPEFYCGAGER